MSLSNGRGIRKCFLSHTARRMGSSVWGVFRSHDLLVAQFVFCQPPSWIFGGARIPFLGCWSHFILFSDFMIFLIRPKYYCVVYITFVMLIKARLHGRLGLAPNCVRIILHVCYPMVTISLFYAIGGNIWKFNYICNKTVEGNKMVQKYDIISHSWEQYGLSVTNFAEIKSQLLSNFFQIINLIE